MKKPKEKPDRVEVNKKRPFVHTYADNLNRICVEPKLSKENYEEAQLDLIEDFFADEDDLVY